MKKSLVFLCLVGSLLMPLKVLSQDFSISGGYGESRDDIQIFRLGVQTPLAREWIRSICPSLELRGEVAYTLWKASKEKTHGVCIAPVFVYVFGGLHPKLLPYVEAGIGGGLGG